MRYRPVDDRLQNLGDLRARAQPEEARDQAERDHGRIRPQVGHEATAQQGHEELVLSAARRG